MVNPFIHALVVRLQAAEMGTLTPHFGHHAQALFLSLLQRSDPQLSTQLHASGAGARHYTVAPLRLPPMHHARLPFRPGDRLSLRITLLRGDLFAPFMNTLLNLCQHKVQLGQLHFMLEDVCGTSELDSWAGYSDWLTLRTAACPTSYLALEFATPTAVSRGQDEHGRPQVELLPLPSTIFSSIARRWNAFAPEPLDLEAVQVAATTVLAASYQLQTSVVHMSNQTTKGFVGHVGYELRGDVEQRRLLAMLADAVFFLGIGMKTARGMGLCRRLSQWPDQTNR
ncbi:MAG: hypothetical protein NVS4B8_26650 [Herpetosiphon sp.]